MADLAGFEFDRDRSFASTVLIVIASYYVLFAVHGGSSQALVVESVAAGGFMLLLFWGVIRGQGCVLLKNIESTPRHVFHQMIAGYQFGSDGRGSASLNSVYI